MRLNYIDNVDCLEGLKDVPDASVDMVLCDLPYGTTQNKWDSVIPFDALWAEYDRVCKPNAAIVLFSQMPFTARLITSRADWFRYEWIWRKNKATGFLNAKKMPLKSHENILVFYRERPTYNPQDLIKKDTPTVNKGSRGRKPEGAGGCNYGKAIKDSIQEYENYPKDVIEFAVEFAPMHPTQKPVDLCEYLIKTYTNPDDVVLDNCMGSGTTAVACIKTGRNYIGFELDEEYYAISQKRIAEAVDELLNV